MRIMGNKVDAEQLRMTYALLLDCYLSHQIPEDDWADRLASDHALRDYVSDYYEYVRREAH